ncbi:MAG: GAF domain-containing protein, partial [Anaerolineae bacterium]|nr:GAF domain-containing protein [Anaerolineae bacterium]
MDFTPSRVSLSLSREVFRRWYLVLIAGGLIFALLIPFVWVAAPPAPWAIWGAFLIIYTLYNLNAVNSHGIELEVVGLVAPLLGAYLTFGLGAALLLLVAGELLLLLYLTLWLHQYPYAPYKFRTHLRQKTLREILTLGGGLVIGVVAYALLGGMQPLVALERADLLRLLALLIATLACRGLLIVLAFRPSLSEVGQAERFYVAFYRLTLDSLLAIPAMLIAYDYQQQNVVQLGFALVLLIIGALALRIMMFSRGSLNRRIDELILLNATSKALASARSQSDLFTLVYNQIQRLMEAPLFYIATFDPEQAVLRYPLVIRSGQSELWPEHPLGSGPVETILKQRRTLQISQEIHAAEVCDRSPAGECRAYLGVPIQFQNLLYGVIAVQHPTRDDAYGITEQHVLETIATQTAIALRNMALRDEAQQFTDGLVAVNHMSGIINASLALDEILKQICGVSHELSRATSAAAFLQVRPGQPYQLVNSVGLPEAVEVALAASITERPETWNHWLSVPRGTIIHDIEANASASWLAPLLVKAGLHAMTVIPFISMRNMLTERKLQPQRDVIGFQVVMFDRPHSPGENELQLLQMLANQTAVAAENTTLFEEAQENVRRLAYMAETARVFTESLSLETVAQSVVQWTVEVLDFDTATLALWDAEANVLDVQAHAVDRGLPYIGSPAIHRPLDALPEFTELMRHRWSQIFAASDEDLSSAMREVFARSGLQRLVLTPLVGRDTALGVIVLGKLTDQPIHGPDVELAESIASQVSIAIENARFYEFTENELTNRVKEINELERVLRTISISTDETEIIHSVLDAAQAITGASMMGCGLVTPEHGLDLIWLVAGGDTLQHRHYPDIHRGNIGECIRTREPVVVGDTETSPTYWIPDGGERYRSNVVAPILHQDRILGVLNLESKRANHFTQAHVRFMQNLAGHAAVAISRARLFASNQRQIEILDTIRVLSLDLLQAKDLESILHQVCRVALNLIQGINIHIYFYDAHTDQLTFAASLWGDGRQNVEVAKPRPNGLTFQAIRNGTPLLSDEFERVPGVPTQRLGIFPLIYRGEIVGALNAAVSDPANMGESEIRALELLTNQAASAIERMRLFESRRRQLELQEALRLNSMTLLNLTEMDRMLQVVCQSALRMVNAESVHIYFYNREAERLTFAASLWGDDRRNVEANTPRKDGITSLTARSGHPQRLMGDQLAETYVGHEVKLIQGIPLKHSEQVVGVLNVAVQEIEQLGPDEVRALELLANQAAAAILSLRLLEAIRAGRDQMETIVHTVRDGLMLVDAHGRLLQANPAAEDLLDTDLRAFQGEGLLSILRRTRREGFAPDDFRHRRHILEQWRSLREDPIAFTTRQIEFEKDGET